MATWDLRHRDSWQRMERQAARDAAAAVMAYWIRDLSADGLPESSGNGRWADDMPGDFAAWAEQLTDDFMQSSIALPRDILQQMRHAYTSRDPQAQQLAQQIQQNYVQREQYARHCYYLAALRMLTNTFTEQVRAYGLLPRRTAPPVTTPLHHEQEGA